MSSSEPNLVEQLRRVLKDAVDYFQSVVLLLQARVADMALSGVVFVILMIFAALLAILSFVLLNNFL